MKERRTRDSYPDRKSSKMWKKSRIGPKNDQNSNQLLRLLLESWDGGCGCSFASIMVGRKRNELMPNAREGEFDGAINLTSATSTTTLPYYRDVYLQNLEVLSDRTKLLPLRQAYILWVALTNLRALRTSQNTLPRSNNHVLYLFNLKYNRKWKKIAR